jgi:hypothetical protein
MAQGSDAPDSWALHVIAAMVAGEPRERLQLLFGRSNTMRRQKNAEFAV